jgi:hypothetical protein
MSTTAPKPVTTPIPVQLSEPESLNSDSIEFRGNTLRFSHYSCYFNTLPPSCLMSANDHLHEGDRWNKLPSRPRSPRRPRYAFRGGLSGAGATSTDSSIAANIERGF